MMIVMMIDFFQRFSDQSADPNANVGGQAMHQPKSSNGFEFVNI
jgi:hypothetical protein